MNKIAQLEKEKNVPFLPDEKEIKREFDLYIEEYEEENTAFFPDELKIDLFKIFKQGIKIGEQKAYDFGLYERGQKAGIKLGKIVGEQEFAKEFIKLIKENYGEEGYYDVLGIVDNLLKQKGAKQ